MIFLLAGESKWGNQSYHMRAGDLGHFLVQKRVGGGKGDKGVNEGKAGFSCAKVKQIQTLGTF